MTTFKSTAKKIADYSQEQLLGLLLQGESEELEFEEQVKEPEFLAQLIGGFANASGGVLVVGAGKTRRIIGCNIGHLKQLLDDAVKMVEPKPNVSLQVAAITNKQFNKQLGIISVEKSSTLTFSNGGVFVQEGDRTRPMSAQDISSFFLEVVS